MSQKSPRSDFPEPSQATSSILRLPKAGQSQKLQFKKGWSQAGPKAQILIFVLALGFWLQPDQAGFKLKSKKIYTVVQN